MKGKKRPRERFRFALKLAQALRVVTELKLRVEWKDEESKLDWSASVESSLWSSASSSSRRSRGRMTS